MGGQKTLSGASSLLHPAASLLPGCLGQHQQRRPRPGFDGGRGNAEFFGGFGLGVAAKVKRVNCFALPGLEVQGQLAHADVVGVERGRGPPPAARGHPARGPRGAGTWLRQPGALATAVSA